MEVRITSGANNTIKWGWGGGWGWGGVTMVTMLAPMKNSLTYSKPDTKVFSFVTGTSWNINYVLLYSGYAVQ